MAFDLYVAGVCLLPVVPLCAPVCRFIMLCIDFLHDCLKVAALAIAFPVLVLMSYSTFYGFLFRDLPRNPTDVPTKLWCIVLGTPHLFTILCLCVCGYSLLRFLSVSGVFARLNLRRHNPVALLNAQQRSLLGNDLAPQEVKQVFWILVLPGFYRVMMQLSISLLGQYYLGKLTPWTNDGAHYEDDLDFAVDLAELYSACADVFEVLALYHFADLLQNAVEHGFKLGRQEQDRRQQTQPGQEEEESMRLRMASNVRHIVKAVVGSFCFSTILHLTYRGLNNLKRHGHLQDWTSPWLPSLLSDFSETSELVLLVASSICSCLAVFVIVSTEHRMETELTRVGFLPQHPATFLDSFLKSKLWGIKLIVSTQFFIRIVLWLLWKLFSNWSIAVQLTLYYTIMSFICFGMSLMHLRAWEPDKWFRLYF
mmetsp:Transcript_25835/g.50598  ORF Transcript_25835/g.50598 Transcript_25835/m.50598 type:complete len:424 (-) Transcript_25835:96-1367(-)